MIKNGGPEGGEAFESLYSPARSLQVRKEPLGTKKIFYTMVSHHATLPSHIPIFYTCVYKVKEQLLCVETAAVLTRNPLVAKLVPGL